MISDGDKYRLILSAWDQGVWEMDLQGRTRQVNHGLADLLGMTPEEMAGVSWPQTVDPSHRDRALRIFQKAVDGQRAQTELRLRGRSGMPVWVKVTLAPLTAQDGRAVGVLGLLSDISQSKLTDMALRTSVERLTVAQEVATDGLWDLDLETGEAFFSSRAYTMLGYEPYEFPPSIESWEKLMHPEDRVGLQKLVRDKTREGLESFEVEFRLRAKDGGWRWVLCRFRVLDWDGQGIPRRLAGTSLDVTERREVEAALLRTADRQRSFLENLPLPVVVFDHAGLVIMVNPAFESTFGWNSRDLAGKTLDFLPEKHRDETLGGEGPAPMDGWDKSQFTKRLTRDGRVLDVLLSTAGFHDQYGNRVGTVVVLRDVTQMKKAEEALKESERKFSTVFRLSPMAVAVISMADGSCLEVSDSFCRLTGFRREELLGRNALDQTLWVQATERDALLDMLERSGQARNYEVQIRHRSGRIREAIVSAEKIELGGGPRMVITLLDITKRKQAEAAMIESQERYRSVVDVSPDAIFIHRDGLFIYANPSTARMFGVSDPGALTGRKVMDFIHPGDRERVQRRISFLQRNGATVPRQEFRFMDAAGATFYVEESGTPIFLGGRVAILTQARDITERKEAERELARAQALLAAAIEQTPAGIIIADAPDAVIRMANSAALDMGGLVEADLQRIRMLGRSARWRVFFPDGSSCPPDAQPLIRAVKEGVTSQNVELIAREDDGTERWLLANAAPVRNTEGEIIAGVVVFPEITGLKQTEQRAREQHEQLIQAAKMASLGTLVAGMAHEINNPNTFIMANAPVLEKIWQGLIPALDDYHQRYRPVEAGHLGWEEIKLLVPNLLGGITEGAKRVKSIVRSLKDYARQQPGDLNEAVDLNQVVESALTLLGNLIAKSTTDFKLERHPDLPLFAGSRQRMEQVVMNLVVNACQALTERGQSVQVTTGYDPERSQVLLTVEDQGAGIAEHDLPHITDPFFTTKRDKRGTGLGLSITSSIVREHGGTMSFVSRPRQGTKVTVSLPCGDVEELDSR